jgi:succinate dehydrogenase / fumarate reductase cytochrome b subunit
VICWSSVCKKIFNGLTGLGLLLFVVVHLAGNLTLLIGPEAFNAYAHFITSLMHGVFPYVAEIGLLLFFFGHVVTGVSVSLSKLKSRRHPYVMTADAGGASHISLSSKTMIVSGSILFIFIVLHIAHFKYGPAEAEGYVVWLHGQELRDLYRYVVEEFNKPLITFGYMFVMVLLGMHLRHGFWSAFQSLGLGSPRLTPVIKGAGFVVALILCIGFLALPIYICLFVDPPAAQAMMEGMPP